MERSKSVFLSMLARRPTSLLEKTTQRCTHMNTSANDNIDPTEHSSHPEELRSLALDGLLPPNYTLVLNPTMRAATLISSAAGDGSTTIVAQQHFSPNGMRVLVPLLEAYPHYCPYDELLARLSVISLEEARRQLRETWDIAIRPVRRAVGTLAAGLKALGLRVHNIHGLGYLIEAFVSSPAKRSR